MKSACYRKYITTETFVHERFYCQCQASLWQYVEGQIILVWHCLLSPLMLTFPAWKTASTLITRINWNMLTDPVLQSSSFLSILLLAGNNGGQLAVALCGFCEALAFEANRNWHIKDWPASVMFRIRLTTYATSFDAQNLYNLPAPYTVMCFTRFLEKGLFPKAAITVQPM